MSDFDTLRVKVGRRPVTLVELVLDFCANTFGNSPCTAAVGVTGAQKCFNTYKTCQDTANYSKASKTYKLCGEADFLPVGEQVFPCVLGVDIAPTQIDPKGFSVSASVTVECKDFPHHDRGVDPYWDGRAYAPGEQGTFFGKLRGRNPYLENRVIRVNTGYIDDDRAIYTQTRTYFIDRIEGPDTGGNLKLVGKDALRFADAEKAKAPAQSQGVLSASLTAIATSFTLLPAGVGSSYAASGTIRIDDEVMTYASMAGDTFNGVTRGTDGTTAATHDAASKVQQCLRYTAQTIPAVLNDLLTTYAGLDASYITMADWNTENSNWLGSFTSTVLLTEPTGVRDLVEEIIESTGCILWWDDISAQVRFKVIAPPLPTMPPALLDEDSHILKDSTRVRELQKERISQVVTYFTIKNPISDLRRENFRSVTIQVDTTGEGVNGYGTSNVRELLNRWAPSEQLATEVGDRLLGRYKDIPRELTFRLDAKDATVKTGDYVDVTTRLIQDVDGLPLTIRYLVTECREVMVGTHYEYKALQVTSSSRRSAALIAPDATPDWTSASDQEKTYYMFISSDAGVMSDLTPGPLIS